jgi:nucleoside-diphosphate-sugar epimerase
MWNLPAAALHRNVDQIIQKAAEQHGDKLHTAIICPPDIYGPGLGLARTQSVYFPLLYAEAARLGQTFYVNSGTNTRSWVHINDLMTMYVRLVEAAAKGGAGADWGLKGYYFTASQEASQYDLAVAAGKVLKRIGVVETEEPKKCTVEEVKAMLSHYGKEDIALYMYAANSRTRADRAKKVLGYQPSAPSIWECIEGDLLAYQKDEQAR